MVKLILYVVVGLFVLSFFGVSLQHLVQSPVTQSNFHYLITLLASGWHQLVTLIIGYWKGVLHTVGL